MPEVDGWKEMKNGRGRAEIKAHLYPSGQLVAQTHAHCTHLTLGLFSKGYVIGKDSNGYVFFITREFNIPTARSTADISGSSDVHGNETFSFKPELCNYVTALDVYVFDREDPSGLDHVIKNTIDAVNRLEGVYNQIPAPVRDMVIHSLGI